MATQIYQAGSYAWISQGGEGYQVSAIPGFGVLRDFYATGRERDDVQATFCHAAALTLLALIVPAPVLYRPARTDGLRRISLKKADGE